MLCELNGSYRLCIRRLLLPRAEKVWEGNGEGSGGAGCWIKEGANCRDCKAGLAGMLGLCTDDCRDMMKGEEI